MSKKQVKAKDTPGEWNQVYEADFSEEEIQTNPDLMFTGIARTVVCSDTNKTFRNFRIHTLHLENGKVIKVDKSDAYVNFETISKLELANEISIMNLDMNWKDGKGLQK